MERPTDPTTHHNPKLEAEIAAIQFEAAEQDRYDREHSFVYRHNGTFYTLGFLMMMACMVMMFAVLPSQSLDQTPDRYWFWAALGLGYTGIFTILFTAVRGGSKNALTTWLKVFTAIGLLLAVVVPLYILLLLGLNALIS